MNFNLSEQEVENFLKKNLNFIYPGKSNIRLIKFQRYLSLSQNSFVAKCEVEIISDKKETKTIWLSLSKKFLKEKSFIINKLLWENGFKDDLAVAKPLCYLKDDNFFIYEDASGISLNDLIKTKDIRSNEAVKKTAQWLKKFQLIKPGSLVKDKFQLYINWQAIKNICSDTDKIKEKYDEVFDGLKSDQNLVIVHGDFQPNNIIINNDILYVIDFDMAGIGNPLFDIAIFQTQIKLRSLELDDLKFFDEINKIFIDQLTRDGYRLANNQLNDYYFLINIQAFSAVCAFLPKEKAHLKIFNYLREEIDKKLKE